MIIFQSLTCLVVGNGAPHYVSEAPIDICITFNGRKPPTGARWHLDVVSHRDDGSTSSEVLITGEGPGHFVERLRDTGSSIASISESALGCWPSSGFTILHALWDFGIAIKVRSICFDPSLRREAYMDARVALPSMYHNWLGERRLSFARWLAAPPSAWDWPLMSPPTTRPQYLHNALPSLYFLTALSGAQQSKRIEDLEKILAIQVQEDSKLVSAGNAYVNALEQYFHLARDVRETSNWWLYDERGSVIIDTLAQSIRACQLTQFAAALTR